MFLTIIQYPTEPFPIDVVPLLYDRKYGEYTIPTTLNSCILSVSDNSLSSPDFREIVSPILYIFSFESSHLTTHSSSFWGSLPSFIRSWLMYSGLSCDTPLSGTVITLTTSSVLLASVNASTVWVANTPLSPLVSFILSTSSLVKPAVDTSLKSIKL